MILSRPQRGQSIRLFLVDGTASGLVVASIPNWTGSVVTGKVVQINELLSRGEARRPGCYVLQGEEPAHPMGVRAYIGQASRLEERLRTHARSRDWWDSAAMISTSDSNFTAGHFLALESKMIQLANDNGRAAIDNQVSPHEHAGGLGEADRADMENFLDQLRLVLPILGFNLLKDSAAKKADQQPVGPTDTPEVLQIVHKSGLTAQAVIRADEFIVLSGSQAIATSPYKFNNYAPLRDTLIKGGVLVAGNHPNFYSFSRDTSFSSSSAAAAVILNRQASGPKEWKLSSTGISLGAWQEEQAKYLTASSEEPAE